MWALKRPHTGRQKQAKRSYSIDFTILTDTKKHKISRRKQFSVERKRKKKYKIKCWHGLEENVYRARVSLSLEKLLPSPLCAWVSSLHTFSERVQAIDGVKSLSFKWYYALSTPTQLCALQIYISLDWKISSQKTQTKKSDDDILQCENSGMLPIECLWLFSQHSRMLDGWWCVWWVLIARLSRLLLAESGELLRVRQERERNESWTKPIKVNGRVFCKKCNHCGFLRMN